MRRLLDVVGMLLGWAILIGLGVVLPVALALHMEDDDFTLFYLLLQH